MCLDEQETGKPTNDFSNQLNLIIGKENWCNYLVNLPINLLHTTMGNGSGGVWYGTRITCVCMLLYARAYFSEARGVLSL